MDESKIRKMTAGNPALVSVNVPLSNLSIATIPTGFIADTVMPRVTVQGISGTYFKWGSSFFLNESVAGDSVLGLQHSGQATYARDTTTPTKETFTLLEYGLEYPLSKEDEEFQAEGVDCAMVAMRLLNSRLAVAREYRVASMLTSTSNITNYTTLSGDNQWNSSAGTSDPAAVCDTAKQTVLSKIGMYPNMVVTSNVVIDALKRNPTVRAAFGTSKPGATPSNEWLAEYLFGEPAPRMVVGYGYYRSTNEGSATDTRVSFWSDNMLVCYVDPNPGKMIPSLGYQFVKNDANLVFEEYDEDQTRTHVYRLREYIVPKITLSDAGYLITDILA